MKKCTRRANTKQTRKEKKQKHYKLPKAYVGSQKLETTLMEQKTIEDSHILSRLRGYQTWKYS